MLTVSLARLSTTDGTPAAAEAPPLLCAAPAGCPFSTTRKVAMPCCKPTRRCSYRRPLPCGFLWEDGRRRPCECTRQLRQAARTQCGLQQAQLWWAAWLLRCPSSAPLWFCRLENSCCLNLQMTGRKQFACPDGGPVMTVTLPGLPRKLLKPGFQPVNTLRQACGPPSV